MPSETHWVALQLPLTQLKVQQSGPVVQEAPAALHWTGAVVLPPVPAPPTPPFPTPPPLKPPAPAFAPPPLPADEPPFEPPSLAPAPPVFFPLSLLLQAVERATAAGTSTRVAARR